MSEIGCYFTASEVLGGLTQRQVFWHLYQYPTRAAAEMARGAQGIVVESFGNVWLYTVAEEGWRPSGGTRVAVIGPLAIAPGKQYTARSGRRRRARRYMEAVFTPGMKTGVHRHSGAEAWYR